MIGEGNGQLPTEKFHACGMDGKVKHALQRNGLGIRIGIDDGLKRMRVQGIKRVEVKVPNVWARKNWHLPIVCVCVNYAIREH